MADEQFAVGDVVTATYRGKPRKITKVTKVLKRYVETADGAKWSHYGGPYPSEPYAMSGLVKTTSEHRLYIRRERAKDALRGATLDQLTLEEMDQILAILKAAEARSKPETL